MDFFPVIEFGLKNCFSVLSRNPFKFSSSQRWGKVKKKPSEKSEGQGMFLVRDFPTYLSHQSRTGFGTRFPMEWMGCQDVSGPGPSVFLDKNALESAAQK
jgi:hypothetical protein